MQTREDLQEKIRRIDGRGYKAYKSIAGEYAFEDFTLIIDHVQGDPFSTPSRLRIRVPRSASGLDEAKTSTQSRWIALRDYLTRIFSDRCQRLARGHRGLGNSGLIAVDRPLQEILDRSALQVDESFVEARIFVGLPAMGRKISGRDAAAMFFRELPAITRSSLFAQHLDPRELECHLATAEDADFIRERLTAAGLVAFIADDARLPRASGIDPRPLATGPVIPFKTPLSFKTEFHLPNGGPTSGMGIPKGVTLIVGGGYHGKSTLLNALEKGVYNHIPGDGRECVITDAGAVKIRAADGRSVKETDISPFIANLPFEKDTQAFSTANASGSTSQAAAIIEALEAGAGVLLLDEDTSATNFMIRDVRMQHLVAKSHEPITPFIDKVRALYGEKGVSTILVMGGSGDYFSVADQVIQMTNYIPEDVTEAAHDIAEKIDTGRVSEGGTTFGGMHGRIPDPKSLCPMRGGGREKISPRGRSEIVFGRTVVDCADVEQIVEVSQTRAIGYAIRYATRYMDGRRTMGEILEKVMCDLAHGGLDILPPHVTGDLSGFRRFELAAAINRMRTLRVRQRGPQT